MILLKCVTWEGGFPSSLLQYSYIYMNNFDYYLTKGLSTDTNDQGIKYIDITKKDIILNLNFNVQNVFIVNYEDDKIYIQSIFSSIINKLENEFVITDILKSIYATVNKNKYNELLQEISFRIKIWNNIDSKYYPIPKLKYHIDKEENQNQTQEDSIPFELEQQYHNCIMYFQQTNANVDTSNSQNCDLIKNVLFNLNLKTISKLLQLLDINCDYKNTGYYLSSLEFNGNFKDKIKLAKLINKAIVSFAIENFGEFIVNISDKTNLTIEEILYLLKKIQEHNYYRNQTKSYRKKSKNSKQKKLLRKIKHIRDNIEYGEIIDIVSKHTDLIEKTKSDGSKDYWCACPFHQETTPSFHIFNERRLHCFGCQWSWDIIDFVQTINWRTLYQTLNSEYFAKIKD